MQRKRNDDLRDYPEFRTFPIVVLLICGIVIFLIGLYLLITNQISGGVVVGKFGGSGAVPISGVGTIIIGILFSIFPTGMLIKNKQQKRK